jgi:hypothetical protein
MSSDGRVSRTLSWLLRHHAADQGLPIRRDGYVPVPSVLDYLRRKEFPHVNLAQLRTVVRAQMSPCTALLRGLVPLAALHAAVSFYPLRSC